MRALPILFLAMCIVLIDRILTKSIYRKIPRLKYIN
jgi:hypothetical protein